MKLALNCLIILAAASLGLAIGSFVRGERIEKRADTSPTGKPTNVSHEAERSRSSHRRDGVRREDTSPLATRLARDLSMTKGVTRWLYWLEALENAQPGDFPRLARMAKGNDTATRFVAARWVEVDAQHFCDTLAADVDRSLPSQLASVLWEEWPKRDPDAAIAALNRTNGFGAQRSWRMRVATTIMDNDVERGLRLMSEWNIENYGPRMKAAAQWAAADPLHAAEFTLAHPAGYASTLTMQTIGKEWARTDPARALEFAASNPGGLSQALASAVMKEWAAKDLTKAGEWLTKNQDFRTINELSSTFLETWAKQDASSALAWCETNLEGSSQAKAVSGVIKGAASRNVGEAAQMVTAMEPSSSRAEAAAAVARKWLPEFGSNKSVPPEALAWMTTLDSQSVKRILDQVHWRWSDADPKSMAAFLAQSDHQVPTQTYSTLARQMARHNPSEALAWAEQLPGNKSVAAGSEAFAEWRRNQPGPAIQWLNDLPPQDERRQPFFRSAVETLAYDPASAEQFRAMNATDRATARGIIANMQLEPHHRARLMEFLGPR